MLDGWLCSGALRFHDQCCCGRTGCFGESARVPRRALLRACAVGHECGPFRGVLLRHGRLFLLPALEAARKPELLAMIRGTTAQLVEIRGDSYNKAISQRH